MNLRLRSTREPVVGFGARLQAAERLIRLGARATVVADALGADPNARTLIRRMYIGLRGPGRPRGPLPFDHVELLGTAAARMEASIFLDAWQRLRDAGSRKDEALAGAWECLASARVGCTGPSRVLGIDQCWVLALSLEQHALHRVCCAACRESYFEPCLRPRRPGQPATVADSYQPTGPAWLRCPHCATLSEASRPGPAVAPAATRHRAVPSMRPPGRASRAPAARAPRPQCNRSHPLADLAQRYAWAEALFREGARPPIVTHVTGLAMTGTLRQLFIEVVGHGPRQGALPQLGEHIISTYARKLQSSVVAVTADRLVRSGYAPAPTLLSTWRTYREVFGTTARFDINAVALVLRARQHPDFALVECRRCACRYLELRLDVPGSRCPVCRQLSRARAHAACT